MIDTVGFYVPISDSDYETLLTKGVMTQRIDKENGLIEFEYTNFRGSMSWNYKIQWKVDNKHIVRDPGVKSPVEIEGIPYLRFEFSVPKVLYGHNLESADIEGLHRSCLIVQAAFERMTGVDIILPDSWYVYRVDTCANFVMEDNAQVRSYIRYLQRLDYPRRQGSMYKDTGLYFASVHNTLKIYAKGQEFKTHDAERFKSDIERFALQKKANNILRIEVENKRRIKYIVERDEEKYHYRLSKFKGWITLTDLLQIMDLKEETARVMKKFLIGKETRVMRSLEVLEILKLALGVRSARHHYAIYMLLVTQGQAEVKRQVPESTYYRATSVFRELNISIVASDIERKEDFQESSEFECLLGKGFPLDFSVEMTEQNKYYQLPKAA